MKPDFGSPAATNGPLFVPREFRELQPPKIPLPRRNYTPQQDIITMTSTPNPSWRRRPVVDLSPHDLERGRQSSLAQRAARSTEPDSPLQRILRALQRTREPMTAADLASDTGLPAHSISAYLCRYHKSHPHGLAVTPLPRGRQQYAWIGTETAP